MIKRLKTAYHSLMLTLQIELFGTKTVKYQDLTNLITRRDLRADDYVKYMQRRIKLSAEINMLHDDIEARQLKLEKLKCS